MSTAVVDSAGTTTGGKAQVGIGAGTRGGAVTDGAAAMAGATGLGMDAADTGAAVATMAVGAETLS